MPLLSTFGAASARSFGGIGAVAAGAGLDVDEVFSTYLYDGTGSAQTITNSIDLSGEGGLVFIKTRTNDVYTGYDGLFFDTERTLGQALKPNGANAEFSISNGFTAFNSNGFSIGSSLELNSNGEDIASWTFRKAPKFFDVVTWSGNGVNGRTISHNLGSTPGMILVKRLDSVDGWITYHRGMDASSPEDYAMFLNLTNARATETYWNNTAPTSTGFTVSSNVKLNGSSGTYVAYLFAHNNSDGNFGPDSDQDIIKCGSYTGTGSEVDVNLGFEPQWILTRRADDPDDWYMVDTMRGIVTSGNDVYLRANLSSAEGTGVDIFDVTSTGFKTKVSARHTSGGTYIYMAVRRGPLAEPESSTDVFAIDVRDDTDAPMYKSGFVTDFSLYRDKAGADDWRATSRLLGATSLFPNTTDVENTAYTDHTWDFMNGFHEAGSINTGYLSWMWKRAPGYFDVVAYSGNSTAGRTVSHNLNAVPEMMWVKRRDTGSSDWAVYHSALGNTKQLVLNSTGAEATVNYWNNTTPTATNFTLHSAARVNASGSNYIAYLFATVAGVSKVGSFTSDGTDMTIDCGFSSGARFVLIKRTDANGNWFLWDTVRGITTGSDPRLRLENTAAEATGNDNIDPDSSGFIINDNILGGSGRDFIFYAIA